VRPAFRGRGPNGVLRFHAAAAELQAAILGLRGGQAQELHHADIPAATAGLLRYVPDTDTICPMCAMCAMWAISQMHGGRWAHFTGIMAKSVLGTNRGDCAQSSRYPGNPAGRAYQYTPYIQTIVSYLN